jgi:2-phosphosulfolactate phosphatase
LKAILFLSPNDLVDAMVKDRPVVVIDVLRASSVIGHALSLGAERVIPADTVEAATSLLASIQRRHALLCGERDGRKIEGFDLGNSPLEYTQKRVEKKTLIYASTNGSRAMVRAAGAREQIIASFNNLGRVTDRVVTYPEITVVCSGKLGQPSLEDTVCAGTLLAAAADRIGPALSLENDAARMATLLAAEYRGEIRRLLDECSHGVYLKSIGFGEDLDFCAAIDSVPVLPVLREGRITAG